MRADIDLGLAADQEKILQVIIEGHIDGDGLTNDYKSDMAIDDILIYDRGACSQTSGESRSPYLVCSIAGMHKDFRRKWSDGKK